jgi:hypothetical protein
LACLQGVSSVKVRLGQNLEVEFTILKYKPATPGGVAGNEFLGHFLQWRSRQNYQARTQLALSCCSAFLFLALPGPFCSGLPYREALKAALPLSQLSWELRLSCV